MEKYFSEIFVQPLAFFLEPRRKLGMKTLDISNCFETVPPPLDFVLPGMLHGTVGALISPGGAGKSLTALQLAIQIASGVDTIGWRRSLPKGPVAYLAAEDPISALHFRLHELGKMLSPQSREEVADQLSIYPLVGGKERINLLDPPTEHGLMEIMQDCRLLILDTLRRFHAANENDSGDMAKVVAAMEHIAAHTGASVLFLHHSSKSSALGGTVDEQQSSRGSSVLVDNVRWQGFLSTMSKSEAKEMDVDPGERRSFVRFGVSKQNYGAPFEDVWFKRGNAGILQAVEFEKTVDPKKKGKMIPRERDGY